MCLKFEIYQIPRLTLAILVKLVKLEFFLVNLNRILVNLEKTASINAVFLCLTYSESRIAA